jgi:hypothetical protein
MVDAFISFFNFKVDKKKEAAGFWRFFPLIIFGIFILGVSLLYVEQQIRLSGLNYEIIALKEKKQKLKEEKKAYELELNSLRMLTIIEAKARQLGLMPPEKGQIRFADPRF